MADVCNVIVLLSSVGIYVCILFCYVNILCIVNVIVILLCQHFICSKPDCYFSTKLFNIPGCSVLIYGFLGCSVSDCSVLGCSVPVLLFAIFQVVVF